MSQQGQQDPNLVIKNLQSACNALESQNNSLRQQHVEVSIQRDRLQEYAQLLEAQAKQLLENRATDGLPTSETLVEEMPASTKSRTRTKSSVN